MAYGARILADSVSPDKVRLTTFEVTFPRIVLAEFNTHRMFSRNSASSRAIPVEKMLKRVKEDPFIPIYWGKNQKGMQADLEIDGSEQRAATHQWLAARDEAIARVEELLLIGIHKQITNRLLEPFLWHTVIVTATEWDNFWGLRCHKDAQPEIRKAAELMKAAYDASSPRECVDNKADGTDAYDYWHCPLVDDYWQLRTAGYSMDDICKISAGRCARVSYLTHDGKRDPKADIELCERLQASGHMSPLEHVARPMRQRDVLPEVKKKGVVAIDVLDIDVREHFSGNFRGWVQYRKTLPHESNFLSRGKVE